MRTWRNFVSTGRVFLGPPTAIIDAAILLDPTQISGRQAVIFRCVFACGLKAMLRDSGTHLLALTGIRPILRVTLCREHRDQGYDWETAHFFKTHMKEAWTAASNNGLLSLPRLRTNDQ